MNNNNQTGIIIQARMGSTRLPGKMAKQFYDGKSLLDVILDRLNPLADSMPVIVATSTNSKDDFIQSTAKENNLKVFRGSEEDVLSRFIGAAEHYSLDKIVRICADNPFLQVKFVQQLINYNPDSAIDYVSFRLNNKQPGIKTHLGFFPEWVSVKALKNIDKDNLNAVYREHVTNYFYEQEHTKIDWIDLTYPEEIINNVRLTIDVENDFAIADEIYRYFQQENIPDSDVEIIKYIQKRPYLIKKMKKNIIKNEK